jgi:type IV pilus assembly protein PilN
MIKINLLSEGRRPAAVRKAKVGTGGGDVALYMLGVGALLGILAAGGYWWILNGRIQEKEQEVDTAQKEVDALAAVIKEVDDFKAKKAKLEGKIKIINDLKQNQRGPVRVMDYISRALPELLWLDRLKMNASNLELEGRAFNTNAVANFMENLGKVPEFQEPTLKDTTDQGAGVYRFLLNFNYSFAPPAPPAGTTPPGAAQGASAAPGAAPGAAAAPVPADDSPAARARAARAAGSPPNPG